MVSLPLLFPSPLIPSLAPKIPTNAHALPPDDNGVCGSQTHTDSVSLALTVGAGLSLTGTTDLFGSQTTFLDLPVFNAGIAFGPPAVCFGFGPAVGS